MYLPSSRWRHTRHLCHRQCVEGKTDDDDEVYPDSSRSTAIGERDDSGDQRDHPAVSKNERVAKDRQESECCLDPHSVSEVG